MGLSPMISNRRPKFGEPHEGGFPRKLFTADRQLESPMKGLSEKISFRKRALGEPMKGLSRKIIISSFKSAWHHAGGKHAETIFGEKGQ